MRSFVSILAGAMALVAIGSAGAQSSKKSPPRAAPKITELRTCPITGETVKGSGGGSAVVGKYRIFFCCAGCKDDWAKMPRADQDKAIAKIAKSSKK